jgi:predicted PurR-regulated permease PerM
VQLYSDAERYYRERLPPSLRPAVDSWTGTGAELLTNTAKKGVGVTFHSVGLVIELFLVPILAFYFLADGPGIRRQTLFFVPRRYLARAETTLDRADDVFQRYIKGQVILCVIAFAVVTLGLWAIDVDFYLLLGLIAGLTRAVPIIGPIVGAIPILIVVLLTRSLTISLWVLVLFSVMHFLESKFLMPAVLGQQLDLHPVLIIVALLIGAQMGGLLGVFLAAPVLAVMKVLVAQRRGDTKREA